MSQESGSIYNLAFLFIVIGIVIIFILRIYVWIYWNI